MLLSNSASSSGVPQPEAAARFQRYLQDPGQPASAANAAYREWWSQHGEAITLADPWLPMLDAQRID